jgi:hypothetical protein
LVEFEDEYNELDKKNDFLAYKINLDTKEVFDTDGKLVENDIFFKIVDRGTYSLIDDKGRVLYVIEDDYVPDSIPNEYNDYLDFNIEEGKIKYLDKYKVISEFVTIGKKYAF